MNTLTAGGHDNTNPFPEFTQQEFKILTLACEFMSNQAIATKLFICEETVKTHRKNIRKKMGISGKTAMTQFLIAFKRSLE